ncbi:c-type cytochrome biogenesis protein CcmI [Puniceibacterium sediminis]|uniref:Cytochrome c-type biogenesis protein CcmH n=1 Tax=Puniceibacterium sediminis TaxID=1608407 RepID=A0A238UYK8_9RHOB|nr:c-type cytochrome biogenesis protein CcmI [Puniceibacterium sediminis]SNR26864.1 cytochrome c-type biogenesis protein CcmH [Puniceibacterium sediminis]
MILFWSLCAALALAMTGLLVTALLRGRRDTGPVQAFDMQVYRDQLREVERDLARGTISPEDGERLRAEVSRRLLTADAQVQGDTGGDTQPRGVALVMAVVVAASLLGGGFWLYARLGAPGYGDLGLKDRIAAAAQARENRPSQQEAESQVPATSPTDAPPEYAELVTRLRAAVAERPDDLQGHILLARSEAALSNFTKAYKAQEQILRLKGDEATAKDYADLADMMVLAAGGYVSPQAEAALDAAMTRDPGNGVARYYGGLMLAQTGRPDAAFRLWDNLLRESAPTDPWVPPITSQIEEMALRAGVNDYRLPETAIPLPGPALPGPGQDDVASAADMTPEQRTQMIQGMVARLSDRLATEGGTPQEWARLIGAYGVLDNQAQAIAIWDNAKEVFAGDEEALKIVREGAANAGIAQ